MTILFVVTYVPSLVRTRSYNLIRHLTARGHHVTVATVWSDERERADVDRLRTICDRVSAVHLPRWRSMVNCVAALPWSAPLQAAYSWSRPFLAEISRLQTEAHVVHVEHLRAARYALHARANPAATAAPVVWDSVDCISYLFEQAAESRHGRVGRMVTRLELPRTRRFEGWLWPQFERVVISSDADRHAITALGAGDEGRISVLPNGVDVGFFTPGPDVREPQTLIFSGKMSYHANVAAVTHLVAEIMPRVWATMPDARLLIVGKDPPPAVRHLAVRHAPRVVVTGTVDDVRPYLRRASAAVIPLVYGAGSQFKVLEAMACATPVVASPRAVSALGTTPGRDVLIGANPESFAREVVGLLSNPRVQRDIGEGGRRYVERHHDWAHIAGDLEAVYDEALAARQLRSVRSGDLLSA